MYGEVAAVKNKSGHVDVKYKTNTFAVCSLSRDRFSAKVTIEYTPRDLLLDVTSLETFLDHTSGRVITAEELCRHIYNNIREAVGPCHLEVRLKASAASHRPIYVVVYQDQEEEDVEQAEE